MKAATIAELPLLAVGMVAELLPPQLIFKLQLLAAPALQLLLPAQILAKPLIG